MARICKLFNLVQSHDKILHTCDNIVKINIKSQNRNIEKIFEKIQCKRQRQILKKCEGFVNIYKIFTFIFTVRPYVFVEKKI